LKWKTHTKPYR